MCLCAFINSWFAIDAECWVCADADAWYWCCWPFSILLFFLLAFRLWDFSFQFLDYGESICMWKGTIHIIAAFKKVFFFFSIIIIISERFHFCSSIQWFRYRISSPSHIDAMKLWSCNSFSFFFSPSFFHSLSLFSIHVLENKKEKKIQVHALLLWSIEHWIDYINGVVYAIRDPRFT